MGVTVFSICVLAGLGAAKLTGQLAVALACALIGIYFLFAIKVVDQWEKVAVLRFGKYRGLRGPGAVFDYPGR